jgi:hypothetical protein
MSDKLDEGARRELPRLLSKLLQCFHEYLLKLGSIREAAAIPPGDKALGHEGDRLGAGCNQWPATTAGDVCIG